MFQPDYSESIPLAERLRARLGDRATAVVVALLFEALLVLAIWSLGQSREEAKEPEQFIASFDAAPEAEQAPEPQQQPEQVPPSQEAAPQQPAAQPPPTSPPQALIPVAAPTAAPVTPVQPEPAKPADTPRPKGPPVKPGAPMQGPANTGYPGDTKSIGKAHNGQPLYPARWVREPYDSELAGFLSTATGPGWGLIECRTVPGNRVEDCVAIDEHPNGSNYARAALAAAWQFQVYPPRVGGKSLVGTWVRIRIEEIFGNRARAK